MTDLLRSRIVGNRGARDARRERLSPLAMDDRSDPRMSMSWLTLGGLLLGLLALASAAWAAPGNVGSEQKISDTAGGFSGALDDADRFGAAIAGLGDLDGNMVPDLAVGAEGDDDGGLASDRGAVWILFLDNTGNVTSEQKISDTTGGFLGALDDDDNFGMAVTSLGDLDGDSVTDIAVGAPGDDDGGSNRGAIWVLFLNANGTVKGHQKISDTVGNFAGTLSNDDQFGFSVTSIRDLDGDGVPDLAVGTPGDSDGGVARGAVWILFLNANGTVKNQAKISDLTAGFGGVLSDLDLFGSSVSAFRDLNNDSVADLAVGAPGDDDGGTDRGAVWVIFLDASGATTGSQKISDLSGGFTGTLDNFDMFGSAVSTVLDLNADDVDDLMVGAVDDDDGGSDRGAVWVLLMNTNGSVSLRRKISSTTGGLTGPLTNGDGFGTSIATPKDINGDGVADILVGATGDDDGGSARGAVYVLLLDGIPGAFCGDGLFDPGEDCDDGNKDDGDCCSASCAFDAPGTVCDDATVCNGSETCDGAGVCDPGTPLDCDDGEPCSQDTCDDVLGCQSTSGPSAVCLVPGKSKLIVVDKADDNKDKIKWKWLKGEETVIADFGDPTSSTEYTLCVYDETAGSPTLTTSLGVPANGAWAANNKGFKYNDKSLAADGVRKIGLKAGVLGKAKVDVFAKGANIDPPLTPFDGSRFYDQDTLVTVQLINSVGQCWSSDLPSPAVKNLVDKFKDKSP